MEPQEVLHLGVGLVVLMAWAVRGNANSSSFVLAVLREPLPLVPVRTGGLGGLLSCFLLAPEDV